MDGAGAAGRPSRAAPLALFVLVAVAITAAGAISYGASATDLRQQKERELATIAALKVDELERWRDERLIDADMIASDPTLLAALSADRPPGGARPGARGLVRRAPRHRRVLRDRAS